MNQGYTYNRKNYFEIPAFLPIERGLSRVGKFISMLHFPPSEMYLLVLAKKLRQMKMKNESFLRNFLALFLTFSEF